MTGKRKSSNKGKLYGPYKNKEDIEKAKKLYMDYIPIAQISQVLGIPRSTIQYHAKKEWSVEREMEKVQLFQALNDSKKVDFTKMTQSAIVIMSKALQALASRPEPPTMGEAQRAADVLNTLDKITRLDEGKATDIVSNQEKPMTIETVRAKIALDPFAKIRNEEPEVIGYEEVEDEGDGD